MFARSRDDVIPKTKAPIGVEKVILTIFVGGVKLISLNALPSSAQGASHFANLECFAE
jgi:hypothetical protein